MSIRPPRAGTFAGDTLTHLRPLIRHVVEILDDECPTCGAKLEIGRRLILGHRVRTATCGCCNLDYTVQVNRDSPERLWSLIVSERPRCLEESSVHAPAIS